MTNPPNQITTLTVSLTAVNSELQEISEAGAKSLKPLGVDVQPVKASMLRLPDAQTALVIKACDMLFAACLEYEEGIWQERKAKSSVQLVTARVAAGRANAVIESLFYGPTQQLLWLALDRAPIAYSGLAAASPSQNIIDRTYRQK
jgi:hypothetical protein